MRNEEEAGQYMVGTGDLGKYFSYANGYYIPDGTHYGPTSLTTGFETDIYDEIGLTTLTGEVREWETDINNDGIVNIERETRLIASGQVILNPNNPIDLRHINIDLTEFNDISFGNDGQYLAIIHVTPEDPPFEDILVEPLSSGVINEYLGNLDYYFAPYDFAFKQLGSPLGRPSSLSDFNGTATDQESRNLDPVDGLTHSWYISMDIRRTISTVDIDDNIQFDIFPNPAIDFFTIDFSLEEVSTSVNIQIVDLAGKIIDNQSFSYVKDQELSINTEQLDYGVYLVNVFTDTGVRSERVFIQR
jgi:hypothetical protein